MEEKHLQEGEWADTEIESYVTCCDCGLTHRMEYRKVNGRLQYRAFIDDTQTHSTRKKMFGKQAMLVTEMLDSSEPWQKWDNNGTQ